MKPPKDYAKELVDEYFYKIVPYVSNSNTAHVVAKRIALQDVENTLKAAFYATNEIYQHYLQVKTEIINLK